ncbi:PREDICTED: uncharacterized protein LOC109356851 isoform X2 [Lupinus angustifolius]|uniref:uncharacterized protein LOC109356851 isoform X2 n=1 Tax=Lupinus angustifolius TaxID=3871 RepID=UPI00092EE887|nr:PREDICTED: uncharacterized protein LOC109356851 isoform X2 [Lupinus angustifolius]
MADFTAPSFSLGFDLDLDLDSHHSPPLSPSPHPNHVSHRFLKRLRRGPPHLSFDADDDIEEFSSQDDDDDDVVVAQAHAHWSARNHSVCSSSKVSLKVCGVLTPHLSSNCSERKRKQASDIPVSVKMETGQSGLMFPKLTTTPLRRFQLIDSDSDDPAGGDASAAQRIHPHSKATTCNKSKTVNSFVQSGSSKMETGPSGLLFPKLASSPLRKFQLIDSDSDDLVDEDVSATHKIDPCSKYAACNQSKPVNSFEKSRKMSFDMNQDQDLWKDFSPVKAFSVPTPAFNEIYEEYFRSSKDKEVEKSVIDISESHNGRYFGANSSCQRDQQLWESAGPLPPAHCYFFHEDPKIQQLVRRRLCNFSPLGVSSVNHQHNVSLIDYMGQFGSTSSSKKQEARKGYVSSSIRGGNKSINLTVDETFEASGRWVDPKFNSPLSKGESSRKKTTRRNSTKSNVSKGKNKKDKSTSSNVPRTSTNWVEPKSCANMPKDAGQRRVQASGQSSGHWYTSDGRRVYVSKSGQELTGGTAYRQYRKESGAGVKKSKAKTSAKKTNSKKRN